MSYFLNIKIIKSTYPENYSSTFNTISYTLERHKVQKTNIVKLAKINRKRVAEAKYNLYENFRNKNISNDTIYLIDNLAHLRNLKYNFKNENVGFFYRDNLWLMVLNEKELMNKSDKKEFNELELKLLEVNENKNLNIKNKDSYYGIGWSHNFGKLGIWSEGEISTLLFKVENIDNDLQLEINCSPYINKINNHMEFDVYVNNTLNVQGSDGPSNTQLNVGSSNEVRNQLIVNIVEKITNATRQNLNISQSLDYTDRYGMCHQVMGQDGRIRSIGKRL